ncbi:MAG: hypothetical protein ACYDHM_16020 [Acidiferrobacterales bacterium]
MGVLVQSAWIRYAGGHLLLGSVCGGFLSWAVRWQFQAEVTRISGGTDTGVYDLEDGGYRQAVCLMAVRWFPVERAEAFEAWEYAASARTWLAGVVYHPCVVTAWKFRCLTASGTTIGTPAGPFAARATLF